MTRRWNAEKAHFDSGLDRMLGDLSSEGASRLGAYIDLLSRWNRRINLISSMEGRILHPLLGEAIWASHKYPRFSSQHLDIGSGAGFPALPIAILRPDVKFVLLESRAKRAAFLETAAYELGLGNVSVVRGRLDSYLQGMAMAGPWRCVSWKGIKLGRKELLQLLRASPEDVRLWVFHGDDLPMDTQSAEECLTLEWREPCPCRSGWFLSEFARKTVSRETT